MAPRMCDARREVLLCSTICISSLRLSVAAFSVFPLRWHDSQRLPYWMISQHSHPGMYRPAGHMSLARDSDSPRVAMSLLDDVIQLRQSLTIIVYEKAIGERVWLELYAWLCRKMISAKNLGKTVFATMRESIRQGAIFLHSFLPKVASSEGSRFLKRLW